MPVILTCENCKQSFQVKPSRAKRSKFCCRKCYVEGKPKRSIPEIVGKKFGKLTTIKKVKYDWLCLCGCGNEHIVRQSHLKNGDVTSCGCHRRKVGKRMAVENGLANPIKIEPGTRFGRWTIIKFDECRNRYSFHICQCDCGKRRSVMTRNLLNGTTQSCSCYHKEVSIKQARKNFTKHGLSKYPWYINWLQRQRRLAQNWTIEMDRLLFELQPSCTICQSTDRLEIDHVIPFNKGGKLEPGNAIVLCRHCNATKFNRDLKDLPTGWQEAIKLAANQFLLAWTSQITDKQQA